MGEGKGGKAKASGEPRMRALGRTKVTIWLDDNELSLIDAAARRDQKKRATWVRAAAYHAAQKSDREERRLPAE
jgi:hypothetical protein